MAFIRTNCTWNQQQTVTTVANWHTQKKINTYVVGLPGVSGNGPAVLDAIATAGGTAPYLTQADPVILQATLHAIASQTVSVAFDSCAIHLSPVAQVPGNLHVVINEAGVEKDVPHMFGGTPAWTISADGSTVNLLGALCDAVKSGIYQGLRFAYGCVSLPTASAP